MIDTLIRDIEAQTVVVLKSFELQRKNDEFNFKIDLYKNRLEIGQKFNAKFISSISSFDTTEATFLKTK